MAGTPHFIDPDGWDAAIADTDGPQLVIAGPGAGKTEFLARRARHLITSGIHGAEVLMLTFSRRATADLRARVGEDLDPGFTAPDTATFHSLSFRILEAYAPSILGWKDMPALLTGPEQVGVIRGLLAEEAPSDWPDRFREMLATHAFAEEVTDFLLRASERLLSPDDVARLSEQHPDWSGIGRFMERVDDHYRAKERIDYAGVLSSAIRVLRDPGVRAALGQRYRYILVDEYQDTTEAQTRLLRLLADPHGNLTATADVDQSIYSFRGADLHNVAQFESVFAKLGNVRNVTLRTSFRVPEEILSAARRLATPGLDGAPAHIEPAAPGGRVDVHVFDQQSHEAEWIASELQRLHLEQKIPYRRMAVLLRTKRRLLPELSRALERRRVPHDRPDARLIDHPAIRIVIDLVELAAARGTDLERERAMRRLLLGPLVGLSLGAERELIREWHRGGAWDELVADRVADGAALGTLIASGEWATDLPAEDGFWHAWTTLPQWKHLVADPTRADFRTAWSSFAQVLGHLAERDPSLSLADFLTLAANDAFEASTLLRYETGEDRLALTTLHQAKGLEFDVVVIADAVDGVLPDLRRSFSLLNTNRLHPDQQTSAGAARFRIEEERRLVYTAMTRATTRVIWTATAAGIEETEGRPSRFLLDVTQGEIPGPPGVRMGNPVTPLEAEAALRRAAADPAGHDPATRLAAIDVLARRPHPAIRPITEFAGHRAIGSTVGLISDSIAFSPSQAMAYDTCPFQYALARHLGIGDASSVHMYQGSLIHRVAEVVDARTLADPAHVPTVQEALEVLDAEFDPAEFGGGPWAEAWKRRAATIITDLIEAPPKGGPVAFVEHPLELDIDGERWRGRADRIDHAPSGSLRVVDYKTGTTMLSVEEAKESLQLGFYVLAASADPAVAEAGEIDGAELWYPANRQKRSIATRTFDMNRLDDVRVRLTEIAAAVRDERFEPSVGNHCTNCRLRILCEEWPEGKEAFTA